MQAFDIRITGEAPDGHAAELATAAVARMLSGGGHVHHASLNGQEVRVIMHHVEIESDDPDDVVKRVVDAADKKLDEQNGE